MRILLALALTCCVQACSLNSNHADSGDGGFGGSSGEGGFGGDGFGGGGFGGSGFSGGGIGGFGGIGGVGGVAMDAGIDLPCGRCTAPQAQLPGLATPCCTPEGRCGLSSSLLFSGCVDNDAHSTPSSRCTPAGGGLFPLDGCCLDNGMCGLSLAEVGINCIERQHFMMSPFFALQPPIDIVCGPRRNDGGVDEDAGESACVYAFPPCDERAICSIEDGIATCECPSGYADLSGVDQPGRTCVDINECLASNACDGGTCTNTPGGFTCTPTDTQ